MPVETVDGLKSGLVPSLRKIRHPALRVLLGGINSHASALSRYNTIDDRTNRENSEI